MLIRVALVGLSCVPAMLAGGCSTTAAGTAERASAAGPVSTVLATSTALPTRLSTELAPLPAGQVPLPNAQRTDPGTGGGSKPAPSKARMSAACANARDIYVLDVVEMSRPPYEAPTQEDVDRAFTFAGAVPDRAKGYFDTLHEAAEQAVGKSPQEVEAIMNGPAAWSANHQLLQYIGRQCDGD